MHPLLNESGNGTSVGSDHDAVHYGLERSESHVVSLKRKKQKVIETELFCRQCGSDSSPEWRKGPEGPRTYVFVYKVRVTYSWLDYVMLVVSRILKGREK